jgi:hypothetical protein
MGHMIPGKSVLGVLVALSVFSCRGDADPLPSTSYSQSPASASATAATLTLAPATTTATSSAPLTTAAADELISGFLATTQAVDRTMHLVWTRRELFGPSDMTGILTFDFAGDEYAGSTDISGGGATFRLELAYVDGTYFERSPLSNDGAWARSTFEIGLVDPLRGLTAGDVEYVGVELIGGQDLHHLRIGDSSVLMRTLIRELMGGMPTDIDRLDTKNSSFDVYVTQGGEPVSARTNLVANPQPSEYTPFSSISTYEFSL